MQSFYYKTNKLGKLHAFIKLYDLGTVVKAAKALNTSQPAISMQIKSLEKMLNCELFCKKGTKLAPTQYCHELYRSITPYVNGIDEVIKNFDNIKNLKSQREVKIAVHHIFLTRKMGNYLSTLSKKIKVHILDIDKNEALQRLRKNEIDLAIYPMNELPEDLTGFEIESHKPLLVMHEANPLKDLDKISPADIATQNVLRIDQKLIVLQPFNEVAKQYGWTSNIKFDSPDWAVLLQLVRCNIGVAVVSEICTDDGRSLVFKDLSHIFPSMKYALVLNKYQFFSDNVIGVVSLFNKAFAEKEMNRQS